MLIKRYWCIDNERIWLASVLALMSTRLDKQRFVEQYLEGLKYRAVSFDGELDMQPDERQEMETYCLNTLYELEKDERE